MAQSGSARSACPKQYTASSWLKPYAQTSPRSNQACASGADVVTGHECFPRS